MKIIEKISLIGAFVVLYLIISIIGMFVYRFIIGDQPYDMNTFFLLLPVAIVAVLYVALYIFLRDKDEIPDLTDQISFYLLLAGILTPIFIEMFSEYVFQHNLNISKYLIEMKYILGATYLLSGSFIITNRTIILISEYKLEEYKNEIDIYLNEYSKISNSLLKHVNEINHSNNTVIIPDPEQLRYKLEVMVVELIALRKYLDSNPQYLIIGKRYYRIMELMEEFPLLISEAIIFLKNNEGQ